MRMPIACGVLGFLWMTASAPAASAAQTMRVDFYHTGNEKEERFSLDRIVLEPLPWPGRAPAGGHALRDVSLQGT